MKNKIVNIEVQFFHGCPNSDEAIRRVKSVVSKLDEIKIIYKETIVNDIETAKKTHFRGSPTILINGEDVEGMPENFTPSLSCRYYPKGLPTVKKLTALVIKEFEIGKI